MNETHISQDNQPNTVEPRVDTPVSDPPVTTSDNPEAISDVTVETAASDENAASAILETPETLETNNAEGQTKTTDTTTVDPAEEVSALQEELANYRKELAQQLEELDSFKTRYVSLAAEFDNFRKRTQREKEEQSKVIKCKTITEILPVVDNFERARTQIKPSTEGEHDIHKSYQGVYKSLVDSLKRLGVSPMRPEGKLFDPQYHEAMLREQTGDHPEDTIIEELVRGYLLDDLVLRHSMVKVAVAPEDFSPGATEVASDPNHGDVAGES